MLNKQTLILIISVNFLFAPFYLAAQNTKTDCSVKLENDLLVIENSKIARTYQWNNGDLITVSLLNKLNGKVWQMKGKQPDLFLPGEAAKATNGKLNVTTIKATSVAFEHVEAEITYSLGQLEVKRVFRLYPDCPVIACDLYYRGVSTSTWLQSIASFGDMKNIEKVTAVSNTKSFPVTERVIMPGKHWKIDAIEFFDITDRFNTLVQPVSSLTYRANFYRGNLLFAQDMTSDNGIFMLKEAPTSSVQLAYPEGDFLTEGSTFDVIGLGISPADLDPNEWRKGYGFVTGVYSGTELERLTALRDYQRKIRKHLPGRDEMILMNTWGDRAADGHINEKFALAEIEAGAKLGITHLQLDDGWQSGRSSNSAFKGGTLTNIWDKKNYWAPDTVKFPHGLAPVVKRGKELGVEVCLWFNPSSDNSNGNWARDANVLIGLYNKYGIRTFKIDGVKIADKMGELNFRKFLDTISRATNYNVVFNLDVTAGRRGGYHYFNEYGNMFLENRYTDWQNYYPFTTLRNLWMLSKYVPAQNLQIEFLNKWRNQQKYKGDPFGPANYSFEYLFSITMPAQPLAWMEGTGLPAEAFNITPTIKKYRAIQHDFQNATVLPIGDEPSGKSWTGFQSIGNKKGYFLVFREDNKGEKHPIKTWLAAGAKIKCTPVTGQGKPFIATVLTNGEVVFALPAKNNYALYHYVIIN
jgi:alpha-galactosidase